MSTDIVSVKDGDRIVLDRRKPDWLPKEHRMYSVYRGEYEMFYFVASKAMIKQIRKLHRVGKVWLGLDDTEAEVVIAAASYKSDLLEMLIDLHVPQESDSRPNETIPEDYYAL